MHINDIWPQGYETAFMLSSTEHEISTAHTTQMLKKNDNKKNKAQRDDVLMS